MSVRRQFTYHFQAKETPVGTKDRASLVVVYLLCCIKLFLCKIVIKIFIGTEALKCITSPNFSFGANFSDNPCILKLKTDTRMIY